MIFEDKHGRFSHENVWKLTICIKKISELIGLIQNSVENCIVQMYMTVRIDASRSKYK